MDLKFEFIHRMAELTQANTFEEEEALVFGFFSLNFSTVVNVRFRALPSAIKVQTESFGSHAFAD